MDIVYRPGLLAKIFSTRKYVSVISAGGNWNGENLCFDGRKIFVYDFNYGSFYGLDSSKRANIRKHFFKFYLPEKPEWGYAGTEPGHVKSTNG